MWSNHISRLLSPGEIFKPLCNTCQSLGNHQDTHLQASFGQWWPWFVFLKVIYIIQYAVTLAVSNCECCKLDDLLCNHIDLVSMIGLSIAFLKMLQNLSIFLLVNFLRHSGLLSPCSTASFLMVTLENPILWYIESHVLGWLPASSSFPLTMIDHPSRRTRPILLSN